MSVLIYDQSPPPAITNPHIDSSQPAPENAVKRPDTLFPPHLQKGKSEVSPMKINDPVSSSSDTQEERHS